MQKVKKSGWTWNWLLPSNGGLSFNLTVNTELPNTDTSFNKRIVWWFKIFVWVTRTREGLTAASAFDDAFTSSYHRCYSCTPEWHLLHFHPYVSQLSIYPSTHPLGKHGMQYVIRKNTELTDALRVVIVSVSAAIAVLSSKLWLADKPSRPHFTSGRSPFIAPAGWWSNMFVFIGIYRHAFQQMQWCRPRNLFLNILLTEQFNVIAGRRQLSAY